MVKVARPVVSSGTVPRAVAPRLNSTLPVGVIPLGEVTVALKVTSWPSEEELGASVTEVAVEPFVTVSVTLLLAVA